MAASPHSKSSVEHVSFERERGVYALEVMRDVAHAVIQVGEDAGRIGRIQRVFSKFASAKIPVFLIKLHRSAVTLAFAASDTSRAVKALGEDGLTADVKDGLALLVVRAGSMRDLHGIMANIADSLFEAAARLYETGDSHNSVQCLIEAESAEAAAARLCAHFHLPADAVKYSSVAVEGAE